MTEKVCWQTAYLQEPTPCFAMAGGLPCSPPDCLVESEAANYSSIYYDQIVRWCHEICRMSSHSRDNQEFMMRTADRRT